MKLIFCFLAQPTVLAWPRFQAFTVGTCPEKQVGPVSDYIIDGRLVFLFFVCVCVFLAWSNSIVSTPIEVLTWGFVYQ
jgi:hypothetical protein